MSQFRFDSSIFDGSRPTQGVEAAGGRHRNTGEPVVELHVRRGQSTAVTVFSLEQAERTVQVLTEAIEQAKNASKA